MTLLIYVNPNKKARAERIIELLDGSPERPDDGITFKNKIAQLIKLDKVKEEDRLEYIYTKLGGLLRTDKEQKEATAKHKKAEAEYKAGKR